jgi:hypothetical protein
MAEIYKEKVTVKVNEEKAVGGDGTDFHEVRIRGNRSHSNLVLTNAYGSRDFEDGKEYELVIREVERKPKTAKTTAAKTSTAKTETDDSKTEDS